MSYRIAATRREIGIRLALGADATRVVGSVAGPLARTVGISVLIGIALALAVAPVFRSGGVPVGDSDPLMLVAVALVVAGAAGSASFGPLRRALQVDPAGSLRVE